MNLKLKEPDYSCTMRIQMLQNSAFKKQLSKSETQSIFLDIIKISGKHRSEFLQQEGHIFIQSRAETSSLIPDP